MNNSTIYENIKCRKHDARKGGVETAFFPIYTAMFIISVILNSTLLYVVTKKVKFLHEKRTFHKLFQILIVLDLIISTLILPNVLIKKFSKDTDTHWYIDLYLGIRDFSISAQMITLVLIAIDRLLAFVIPISDFWKLDTVILIFKLLLVIMGLSYISRVILLNVDISCSLKIIIDEKAKDIIGKTGGTFMSLNFIIYIVLFSLLCRRHILHQQQSIVSEKLYMSMKSVEKNELPETNEITEISCKKNSKSNKKTSTITRKTGSIKFAKVLLGVNILMIISFLPAVLYNGAAISFPSFSVYYLFYLHSLGDPVLFFVTQKELKNGLISIFKDMQIPKVL